MLKYRLVRRIKPLVKFVLLTYCDMCLLRLRFKMKCRKSVINLEESSTYMQEPGVPGLLRHYLRESSIHGVKYAGIRNLHIFERVFWITAVAAAIGFSAFLVQQVIRKYYDNPIIISFQPIETKIAQIPFPAITICNVNIMKRTVLNEAQEELRQKYYTFLRQVANGDDAPAFTPNDIAESVGMSSQLSQVCLAQPNFRRLINDTIFDSHGNPDMLYRFPQIMAQFVDAGHLTNPGSLEIPKEVMDKLNEFGGRAITNCSQLIVRCMWALEFLPCEELFSSVRTEHGMCCQFNMMPSTILRQDHWDDWAETPKSKERNEPWTQFKEGGLILSMEEVEKVKKPFHQKSGGKQYGLTLLINPDLDEYSTCTSHDSWGFKIVAHSPLSFPRVTQYGAAIPTNSEVFIEIDPLVTTADQSSLGRIGVKKRGCYFPTDNQAKLTHYNFYSAENCIDECVARYTFENCSCIQFYMPQFNDSQRLCSAIEQKCCEGVRVNLMTKGTADGKCSHCRPPCTDIKYKMQLSHFPLRDQYNESTHKYDVGDSEEKTASKYSIVHIFFGTDSFNVKERKRLYDFWDLLANTGGLLGFALGLSIVSAVEIAYFLTIRAWFHLQYHRQKETTAGNHHNFPWITCSSSSRRQASQQKSLIRPRQQQQIHDFYSAYYSQNNNLVFGYYR